MVRIFHLIVQGSRSRAATLTSFTCACWESPVRLSHKIDKRGGDGLAHTRMFWTGWGHTSTCPLCNEEQFLLARSSPKVPHLKGHALRFFPDTTFPHLLWSNGRWVGNASWRLNTPKPHTQVEDVSWPLFCSLLVHMNKEAELEGCSPSNLVQNLHSWRFIFNKVLSVLEIWRQVVVAVNEYPKLVVHVT